MFDRIRRIRSKTLALLSFATLSCMILTGCPSQQTTANLVTIVGQSVASVVAIQGNTALAEHLTADFQAASVAVAGWKPGTPSQNVVQALNLLQADLALIPATPEVKVYIELAVTTIDSIIAITSPSTTPTLTRSTRSPITVKQYKAQWNALVAANPKFAGAALK